MKGSYYFISIGLNLLLAISLVVDTKIVTTYAQHPNNNITEIPSTPSTHTNVTETLLISVGTVTTTQTNITETCAPN